MPKFSTQLTERAQIQHGMVTTGQLLEDGWSRPMISRATTAGLLHRRHRGVLALGHVPPSREARWSAAVLASGGGAGLAGFANSQLRGITRRRTNRIHVLVPTQRRAIRGVTTSVWSALRPDDIEIVDGIRALTLAALIVHMATLVPVTEVANLLHEAEFHGLLDLDDMQEMLDRPGRMLGREAAWNALRMNLVGEAGSMSRLEDDVIAYLDALGVERARINAAYHDAQGSMRLDLWWPERHLCVEVDGSGHTRRRTQREDEARELRLTSAGIRVLRVGEIAFRCNPDRAMATTREALGLDRVPSA